MVVALRNLEDLRNPVHVTDFFSTETVSDHNQYVLGDYTYQANYCAGLQILHIDRSADQPVLSRVGYYDNAPDCNSPTFSGSWSVFPYFASGTVVFTSIERGFYAVDPSAALAPGLKGTPSFVNATRSL